MSDEPYVLEQVRDGFYMRPYQTDGVEKIYAALEQYGRGLGILATGTGKTEIAIGLLPKYPKGVLFITPRDVLVGQTVERFRLRGVQCGVEQGGERSDESVTVACYNSLLSRRRYERYIGTIDLVIVDEVHTNFSRRALQMLDSLTQGGVRLLGLTASPERAKGDPLTSFYGRVAYFYGIREATNDGWLVPAKVWLSIVKEMDLSHIRSRRFGDFDQDELARIMAQESVVQAIASLIADHYDNQPSVVFAASIRQTELLIDVLARRGIQAVMVHSMMDANERRMHLDDFESGRINIIVNVGVLTLGWDSPRVRKLFLARPTKSKAVYVQQYGRGTRTLPGTLNGCRTAEERRAAIAASEKKCFEIFDITDSSRHCDICSALDALHPDLDPELKKRSRKQQERNPGAQDIDAVVAEAKAEQAREDAARERMEWEKRRDMIVGHMIDNYARDPHTRAEEQEKRRGWHMLFGKHKGKPLRLVPADYLRWVVTASNCRNRDFLDAVRRELRGRGA